MYVNIHAHTDIDTNIHVIRNLTFSGAYNIFATKVKGMYSLGFHPWYADTYSNELMYKMREWIKDDRFVAVGECGLDKNSNVSIEEQIKIFELQITLSENAQKPMIIHCVGCFNELFEIKKRLNPCQTWIIHGFRGKPELAKQAIKSGCKLSFGEHFNEDSVRITPIDQIFLETDDSHIPIKNVYHLISVIKNCKDDDLIAGENLIKSMTPHST
jgi:TatD DNase family protein